MDGSHYGESWSSLCKLRGRVGTNAQSDLLVRQLARWVRVVYAVPTITVEHYGAVLRSVDDTIEGGCLIVEPQTR